MVFVGLSIGGLIGQSLAARRPELLRGLVISNSAAKIGEAAMWQDRIAAIRKELQDEMDKNAQVFRTDESLASVTETIHGLRERYKNIQVQDKGKRFNTDLLEAIELGFLLDLAEVVVFSARNRQESRGDPHSADAADHITLAWKPVVVTRYQPMERKY